MTDCFAALHQEAPQENLYLITDTNRVLFLDKKESASIARLKTPLALVVQPVNDPLL